MLACLVVLGRGREDLGSALAPIGPHLANLGFRRSEPVGERDGGGRST
jgi:hypothetical protein